MGKQLRCAWGEACPSPSMSELCFPLPALTEGFAQYLSFRSDHMSSNMETKECLLCHCSGRCSWCFVLEKPPCRASCSWADLQKTHWTIPSSLHISVPTPATPGERQKRKNKNGMALVFFLRAIVSALSVSACLALFSHFLSNHKPHQTKLSYSGSWEQSAAFHSSIPF